MHLLVSISVFIAELQVRALPGVAAPGASQPLLLASSLLGMDGESVCP